MLFFEFEPEKKDAEYRRSVVKIGNNYEITDCWIHFNNVNLEGKINYSNSKRHGIEKHYNEKGVITQLTTWVNDIREGACKEVDDDGAYFDGFFKNNKYDGTWKGFYANGKPKVENVWDNGLLKEVKFHNDANGNPLDKGTISNGSGTRKVYNNQGKLIRIETYEAGKFISEYVVK